MENNVNVGATEVTEEKVQIKRDFAPHRRVSVRICKDCGKIYILSDNDAVHFATKYGGLPLRCEECRKRVREAHPWPTTKEDDSE